MSCIERAEEKGKEKGREEGREERAVEIARSLKLNGVNIEVISKSTGLAIKEIENL